MGGPRERQGFPSQGTEGVRQNIVLDEGPQASVIAKIEEKIYDVIKPQVGLDSSQLSEYNDVIHSFARSLTLRCQSVLASHQSIIFAGATPAQKNESVMRKLEKMATNIAKHFAEQFLLKVMERQELADGRTSYRVLYARLISDFYLSQIETIDLTEEGFENQDNIALRPNEAIRGLEDISEFLQPTPIDQFVQRVADIAIKPNFQPENIRRMAVNRYRHITDGSDNVSFVGRGNILDENVRVIIAMSRMSPEQRKQVYMKMIGLNRDGTLNFGSGGEMMEYELKALKLGILMGDFTPISFKAFVYQHSPLGVRVRNVRYIDKFLSTRSGRRAAGGVSSGFDMYNLDNQDQTNLGHAETYRQAHVSQGHIGETIYYGALHLNALVSFGVNLSQLATIARQAGQGQQFTSEQVQSTFKKMGIPIPVLPGALTKMTEFANQIAAVAQPIAFILVSTFASMVATRKMANPSMSLDVVVDEVFNDFKENNIIRTITNDPDLSRVSIPLAKKTFANTIMKASYLSTKGFAVLHRQSVLNSLGQTARNSSNSYPTLASFLNSLNQQDRNDFIKYVLPSFSEVEDRSAFWSDFILEYSLLSSIMPSRDQLLMVYDCKLPTGIAGSPGPAGSAYTTNVLLSDRGIQPSSAGDASIPQFAYSRHATRQGNRYRLADRSASAPYTSSYRSLESYEVERTNLINRDKVFRLTNAQKSTLATYGISAQRDRSQQDGILTYSPALTPDSSPQTFRVVENLRQRRMVWGEVESIDENANTIVINSKNFRPITIPFQTIPVMPQTPFQRMDDNVFPNSLSEVPNTNTGDTLTTLRYIDGTSLAQVIPGIHFNNQIPQSLTAQQIVNRFNQVRRSGELSPAQYQILQILIREQAAKMHQGQIQVIQANKNKLLKFKKAPNIAQPIDIGLLDVNSDFEFIKKGNQIGIFVQNHEEVFRQIPALLTHAENHKGFQWKMQEVLDCLDRKESNLTPVEFMIYQKLLELYHAEEVDLEGLDFLIKFPPRTQISLPGYGLVPQNSGSTEFINIPNPSGYFTQSRLLDANNLNFHQGQIRFTSVADVVTAGLERKQKAVQVYETSELHQMELNAQNPFALLKTDESSYVLYSRVSGLEDSGDELIQNLWVPHGAGYAAAILRSLNAKFNPGTQRFTIGAKSLDLRYIQSDLAPKQDLEYQEGLSLSQADIDWFRGVSGGIVLNSERPPLLDLNTTANYIPYLPSLEFFYQTTTEDTNKIIQSIQQRKTPAALKPFKPIIKSEDPAGSPQLPANNQLAGKTFVEALSQLNSDPSGFDVRVFHLLRKHYGLTVTLANVFVLPQDHLNKSFSTTALTTDTPESNIDALNQRLKAQIGINARGEFDFTYPYFPVAPAGGSLRTANFNEITFRDDVYVDVNRKRGYSAEIASNSDTIKDLQRNPLSSEHARVLSEVGITIAGNNGRIIYGFPISHGGKNFSSPQNLNLENSYLPLGNISDIQTAMNGQNLNITITVLHPNGQTTQRVLELPPQPNSPVPYFNSPSDVEGSPTTYIVRDQATLSIHYQGLSFPPGVTNIDSLITFLNQQRESGNTTLKSIRQTLLEQDILKINPDNGDLQKAPNAPTHLNLTLNTGIENDQRDDILVALNALLNNEGEEILRSLPASFTAAGRTFVYREGSYFLQDEPGCELILNRENFKIKVDKTQIFSGNKRNAINAIKILQPAIYTHRILTPPVVDGLAKVTDSLNQFTLEGIIYTIQTNSNTPEVITLQQGEGTNLIQTQISSLDELKGLIRVQKAISNIPESDRANLRSRLLEIEVITTVNQQIPHSITLNGKSFTFTKVENDNQLVYQRQDGGITAQIKIYPQQGYTNQFDLMLSFGNTRVYPFEGMNVEARKTTLSNSLSTTLETFKSALTANLSTGFTYHDTPPNKILSYPVIKYRSNFYALEKSGDEFIVTQLNTDLAKTQESLRASGGDLNRILRDIQFHESVENPLRDNARALLTDSGFLVANSFLEDHLNYFDIDGLKVHLCIQPSLSPDKLTYKASDNLYVTFENNTVSILVHSPRTDRLETRERFTLTNVITLGDQLGLVDTLLQYENERAARVEENSIMQEVASFYSSRSSHAYSRTGGYITRVVKREGRQYLRLTTLEQDDSSSNFRVKTKNYNILATPKDNGGFRYQFGLPDAVQSSTVYQNRADLMKAISDLVDFSGQEVSQATTTLSTLGLSTLSSGTPPMRININGKKYVRNVIVGINPRSTTIDYISNEEPSNTLRIKINAESQIEELSFDYNDDTLIDASADQIARIDRNTIGNLIQNQTRLNSLEAQLPRQLNYRHSKPLEDGLLEHTLDFQLGVKNYQISYQNNEYVLTATNSNPEQFTDSNSLITRINQLRETQETDAEDSYSEMTQFLREENSVISVVGESGEATTEGRFNALLESIDISGGIQNRFVLSDQMFDFESFDDETQVAVYTSIYSTLTFDLKNNKVKLRIEEFTTEDPAEILRIDHCITKVQKEKSLASTAGEQDLITVNLDSYPYTFSKGSQTYEIHYNPDNTNIVQITPQTEGAVTQEIQISSPLQYMQEIYFEKYVEEIALFTPQQIQERQSYFSSIGLTENPIENNLSLTIAGQEYQRKKIDGNKFIYERRGVKLTFTKNESGFSLTNLNKGEFQYPLPTMSAPETKEFLENFTQKMENFQFAIDKALQLTRLTDVGWNGPRSYYQLKIADTRYYLLYNGTSYSLQEISDSNIPNPLYDIRPGEIDITVRALVDANVTR